MVAPCRGTDPTYQVQETRAPVRCLGPRVPKGENRLPPGQSIFLPAMRKRCPGSPPLETHRVDVAPVSRQVIRGVELSLGRGSYLRVPRSKRVRLRFLSASALASPRSKRGRRGAANAVASIRATKSNSFRRCANVVLNPRLRVPLPASGLPVTSKSFPLSTLIVGTFVRSSGWPRSDGAIAIFVPTGRRCSISIKCGLRRHPSTPLCKRRGQICLLRAATAELGARHRACDALPSGPLTICQI
jgi:hypothetical protein